LRRPPTPRPAGGGAENTYLNQVRRRGTATPPPGLAGAARDGKPMKLSDYRGKVVVLYFCGIQHSSVTRAPGLEPLAVRVQDVLKRHSQEPIVALGVTVADVIDVSALGSALYIDGPRPAIIGLDLPKGERQRKAPSRAEFKAAVDAGKLPVRFWWDEGEDGKPGPIQTSWHTRRRDIILIDQLGVIRYKDLYTDELLENAIRKLLDERKNDLGR